MGFNDAFQQAPPPDSGTFDQWLPIDAVLAAMGNEGDAIPTGWAPLDRQFRRGGVTPGRIITVGGEPFSGKTTIIAAIALHVAQQHPVFALFSDEGRDQAAIRMAVMLGAQLKEVEEHPERAASLVAELAGERTIYLSKPDTEEAHAEAVVKHAKANTPSGMPALIILDSVQTIPRSGEADEDERLGIKAFMKACRKWAAENRFVILLSSQANRESYKYRGTGKNTRRLSSFSGSAAIEFMSDVALVIGERDEQEVAPVELVKNRLGTMKGFSVRYDEAAGKMLEVDAPIVEEQKTQAKEKEHQEAVSKKADQIERLLRKKGGRYLVRTLTDVLGGKYTTVGAALAGLEETGVVDWMAGPRGGALWGLKGHANEETRVAINPPTEDKTE